MRSTRGAADPRCATPLGVCSSQASAHSWPILLRPPTIELRGVKFGPLLAEVFDATNLGISTWFKNSMPGILKIPATMPSSAEMALFEPGPGGEGRNRVPHLCLMDHLLARRCGSMRHGALEMHRSNEPRWHSCRPGPSPFSLAGFGDCSWAVHVLDKLRVSLSLPVECPRGSKSPSACLQTAHAYECPVYAGNVWPR